MSEFVIFCNVSNLFQRISLGTSVFHALKASKNRLSSRTPGESIRSRNSISFNSLIRAFNFKYLINLYRRKFVLTLQNVFVLESERLLELVHDSSLKFLKGSLDSDFSSKVNIENGLSSYSFPRKLYSWEFFGFQFFPLECFQKIPYRKTQHIFLFVLSNSISVYEDSH